MPQASPDVPPRVRKSIPIIPLVIALIIAVAGVFWAVSHLVAKGPAPQLESSDTTVATGQTPETRDAYNASDYTEPDRK